MTASPEGNDYKRKHYTLDANSEDIVDDLADSHHNGNKSEAVRASVRFRHRWSFRDKSLPTEIRHALAQIEEVLLGLEAEVEDLRDRVEDAERAASDASEEEVSRSRDKRQVLGSLSTTEGRRIDTVAEEVGLSLRDAVLAAENLEDNNRIVRTNEEGKEVHFKKLS